MNRRGFLFTAAAAGLSTARCFTPSGPEGPSDAPPANSPATPSSGTLRLNSNENPMGLAESAQKAILDTLKDANRYPFRRYAGLKKLIADGHGVAPENIVLGNGSSEVLYLAVQAFAKTRGKLVVPTPTFEALPDYAAAHKLEVERVPLAADYAHDLGRMEETARSAKTPALVYICNPNNPTGTLTPSSEVRAWTKRAAESVWFVIDEAYFHFVDDASYQSSIEWAIRRPNTIVARTFSKIYAMAGLRLGYGLASPKTIERLAAFSPDVPINHVAVSAGEACFSDQDYLKRSYDSNARSRAILTDTLAELEIEHLPSHTNFLMHRIQGDLKQYIDRMSEADILVGRPFPPMTDWCRVSLGLPEETERFCGQLRKFRSQGWV